MANLKEIGIAAWENLKKDKAFKAEQPPNAFQVFETFLVGFPEEAGEEIMDAKADLRRVLNTKLLFLEYVLKNDFVRKYTEAIGMGSELFSLLNSSVSVLVNTFKSAASNIPEFLEGLGVSEEEALSMMSENNKKLLKQLKSGMTIGELYQNYPAIIVKNT